MTRERLLTALAAVLVAAAVYPDGGVAAAAWDGAQWTSGAAAAASGWGTETYADGALD